MFVDVCVFVCVCTQIQHLEQQWICTAVCLQGRAELQQDISVCY